MQKISNQSQRKIFSDTFKIYIQACKGPALVNLIASGNDSNNNNDTEDSSIMSKDWTGRIVTWSNDKIVTFVMNSSRFKMLTNSGQTIEELMEKLKLLEKLTMDTLEEKWRGIKAIETMMNEIKPVNNEQDNFFKDLRKKIAKVHALERIYTTVNDEDATSIMEEINKKINSLQLKRYDNDIIYTAINNIIKNSTIDITINEVVNKNKIKPIKNKINAAIDLLNEEFIFYPVENIAP